MQSQEKIKLIIDTDPGIDDAIALLMALSHPQIEVLGITTVFGNASLDLVTKNALRILEKFKFEHIPVYRGASAALYPYPLESTAEIHGQDALGNLFAPDPRIAAQKIPAAQFLVEQLLRYPGEVVICAIAPLSNLALALALEPSIVTKVKQVIIMGGAVFGGGNVTPAAEANFYNDPLAADRVLNAGWPVTLLGLDLTHQAIIDRSILADLAEQGGELGKFIEQISQVYLRFYTEFRGLGGFAAHDPTAVAYLLHPELFDCVPGLVRVLTDGIAKGASIMAKPNQFSVNDGWRECSTINIATKLRVGEFQNLIRGYFTPGEVR